VPRRDVRVRLVVEDEFSDELKRFKREATEASREVSASWGELAVGMGAVAAAVKSALLGVGKAVISQGAAWETMKVQLKSVEGSVEGASRALAWIRDWARRTPYELQDAINTYIQLKNFGLDPLSGSMQAIADMAARLGGSQETLRRITIALGQAWTKQKLQAEEALQLMEAGVPVWDILADKLGLTTAQLQELASEGALGRDVIQALIEGMGELAAGASEAQMETFTGQLSNLKDLLTVIATEISEGGVMDAAKEAIGALADELERMRESGEIADLARAIAEQVREIAEILPQILRTTAQLVATLDELLPIAQRLAVVFGTMWAVGKLQRFIGVLRGLPAALSGAAAAAGSLSGPIQALAGVVALAGMEMSALHDRLKELHPEFYGVEKGAAASAKELKAWSEALTALYGSLEAAESALQMAPERALRLAKALREQGEVLRGELGRAWLVYQKRLEGVTKASERATKAARTHGKALDLEAKKAAELDRRLREAQARWEEEAALMEETYRLNRDLLQQSGILKRAREELNRELTEEISNLFEKVRTDQRLISITPELTRKTLDLAKAHAKLKTQVLGVEQAALAAYHSIQRGLGDLIFDSITGRFGDIEDAWRRLWEGLASDLADALSQALTAEGLGSPQEWMGKITDLFFEKDESGKVVGLTGLGLAGAGVGSLAALIGGVQQGGIPGALTAGAGAAGLTAVLGALFPSTWIGAFAGPVGLAVAAVTALLSGIFGGSDGPPPRPDVYTRWTAAGGAEVWGGDFPAGFAPSKLERSIQDVVAKTHEQFLDILELFGEEDLFGLADLQDLIISWEGHPAASDLKNVLDEFLSYYVPGQVQNAVADAFYKGFGELGMSSGWVDRLFQQLAGYDTDERLQKLQDVVRGVVGIANAVEDVSWENVSKLADETPWEAFGRSMNEFLDQIAVIQARMEAEIDIAAAGQDAARIAELVQQAGQAARQMLAQIRAIGQAIHEAIQAQLESYQLEEMAPAERASYLKGRIEALMEQLAAATSPDEVQRIVQQIQQYAAMFREAEKAAEAARSAFESSLDALREAIAGLSWEALTEGIGRSEWETFVAGMQGFLDQVADIQDRIQTEVDPAALAADARALTSVLDAAGQAARQMIERIRSIAEGIHQSIQQQLEGFRLDLMDPRQKLDFFTQRIQELLTALANATSPEMVQAIMNQIQQYAGSIWQILTSSGAPPGLLEQWLAWLEQVLGAAEETAGGMLGGMEDDVRSYLDALRDAAQGASDALGDVAQTFEDFDWEAWLEQILMNLDELSQGILAGMEDDIRAWLDELQGAAELARDTLAGFGSATEATAQSMVDLSGAAGAAVESLYELADALTAANFALAGGIGDQPAAAAAAPRLEREQRTVIVQPQIEVRVTGDIGAFISDLEAFVRDVIEEELQ